VSNLSVDINFLKGPIEPLKPHLDEPGQFLESPFIEDRSRKFMEEELRAAWKAFAGSIGEKMVGEKIRIQILTDEDFEAVTHELGAIVKGRLVSWKPEESSHEELLFEEAERELSSEDS